MRYNLDMPFVLVKEQSVTKPNGVYFVKLFFNEDTNMCRNLYAIGDEPLYHFDYEVSPYTIPETDINFGMIMDDFMRWYDIIDPDWRPDAFPDGPYPNALLQ